MGERLEKFIAALGMKKKDFAEALGLLQPNLAPFIGEDAKLPKDEIVQKIAGMGLDVHWWVTGEGSMFANNEAGESLAAQVNTGVTKSKNTLPSWAASITTTPSERLAKVIELLGGLEQAETILSTPRNEIQRAIDREDGRFPVVRDCAKLGFSMDWIYLAKGMYYDGTEKGAALRKAVETNTVVDWAYSLYTKALGEMNNTPDAPRTIGSRMGLARIWLCEYHGIPSTPKSFAEFLTKSKYNYAKHVFTAKNVIDWETDTIPPNDAMPIAGKEGVNVFWIMTGIEDYPYFSDSEVGERLTQWFEERIARVEMETV